MFKYDPNDPLEQDIIYQELDLPWPISPREILLHRSFHFNEQQRSISINYKSVEDDRIPITPGAIRTFTPFTSWKFKAICNEELAGYNVPSGTHDSVDSSNSDVDRNSQEMNKAQKFFATIKRKVRSVFRRKGEASTNTHNSNDNKSNEQRSRCRSTHTHVEIECLVDSKGSVPSWFINYMQRLVAKSR